MRYYLNINEDDNGYREVHTSDCFFCPGPSDRIDLGYHDNCEGALAHARQYYDNIDGCEHCSKECHKG